MFSDGTRLSVRVVMYDMCVCAQVRCFASLYLSTSRTLELSNSRLSISWPVSPVPSPPHFLCPLFLQSSHLTPTFPASSLFDLSAHFLIPVVPISMFLHFLAWKWKKSSGHNKNIHRIIKLDGSRCFCRRGRPDRAWKRNVCIQAWGFEKAGECGHTVRPCAVFLRPQ